MEKSFVMGVVSLVKSALTGEKTTLPSDFDFENAFKLAKSHRIIPLIYYGMVNSGVSCEPSLMEKYFKYTCQSISVSELQKFELAKLTKEFEEAGIDYMLLKGSVIRDIYPKSEMRSMGDADILIHVEQYDKMIPILEKNGLKFVKENLNEICWDKHPFYVELHRYLVSPGHKDYFKFFGDGWKYARLAEGYKHKYEMSDEDFFVFLFAHLTKHYRSSGIGIKHITDIWVYLNAKPDLDMEYVRRELDKLKMLQFFQNVLRMIDAWFKGADYDDITYLITEKIFASGAFGTGESSNKSKAIKDLKSGEVKNTRVHRVLTAVFIPYKNMCFLFPILKKVPVLLPFMHVYRWIYTLVCKKGTLTKYYNSIKELSPQQLSQYEQELNAVGLDYHLEEIDE